MKNANDTTNRSMPSNIEQQFDELQNKFLQYEQILFQNNLLIDHNSGQLQSRDSTLEQMKTIDSQEYKV